MFEWICIKMQEYPRQYHTKDSLVIFQLDNIVCLLNLWSKRNSPLLSSSFLKILLWSANMLLVKQYISSHVAIGTWKVWISKGTETGVRHYKEDLLYSNTWEITDFGIQDSKIWSLAYSRQLWPMQNQNHKQFLSFLFDGHLFLGMFP